LASDKLEGDGVRRSTALQGADNSCPTIDRRCQEGSPVESIFFIAGIWLFISIIAAIIAYHLDISIALVEI
jgi:hypothetical protein